MFSSQHQQVYHNMNNRNFPHHHVREYPNVNSPNWNRYVSSHNNEFMNNNYNRYLDFQRGVQDQEISQHYHNTPIYATEYNNSFPYDGHYRNSWNESSTRRVDNSINGGETELYSRHKDENQRPFNPNWGFNDSNKKFIRYDEPLIGDIHERYDNSWKNWGKRGTDLLFHQGWWRPRADILEIDGHLRIEFELPGVHKDNIHLRLLDDILTLSSTKHMTKKEENGNYYQNERHFGHFYRRLLLPFKCDSENLHAHLDSGILRITLTKSSEEESHSIQDTEFQPVSSAQTQKEKERQRYEANFSNGSNSNANVGQSQQSSNMNINAVPSRK